MAAQENTAINNLLQIVAAQRVGFDQVRAVDRVAPPAPPPLPPPAPRPPVKPIFAAEDDDAATQFVERDDAQTHVNEPFDEASTNFVERYQGRIPEATPRGAWSPADMRSTSERMVDVVALRAVSRTAPPRAGDIPSLRRPDATPHGRPLEAPALSAPVVAVHVPYTHAYQQPPLGVEVRRTLRKLAAPITFVALFAISLSTYLALAGGGDTVATASAAPAPAPVAVKAPPPAPPPAPAPKPEVVPIVEESAANVSADNTGEETPSSVEEPAADEIEMDAVGIERPRPSKPRPRLDLAKKETPKKGTPKKETKKETKKELEKESRPKVEEGELPANIANKTSSETGAILVTSNVPALIYLDGRNTGMMTPKQFSVPAGPHKITLLEPGSRKARTQDVKVLPGKTASVDKQF